MRLHWGKLVVKQDIFWLHWGRQNLAKQMSELLLVKNCQLKNSTSFSLTFISNRKQAIIKNSLRFTAI
jgi:hypothetical protein